MKRNLAGAANIVTVSFVMNAQPIGLDFVDILEANLTAEVIAQDALVSRRRGVKVITANDYWLTEINGTVEEINAYYLGKSFSGQIVTAVEFLG